MADKVKLVDVEPDGTAGKTLGVITFDGETLTGDTKAATELVESWRFQSRKPDPHIWNVVRERGWSNGYRMITPE